MKRLRQYFLDNGYVLKHDYSEKQFAYEKFGEGDWSKIVYVRKYGRKYNVEILEGTKNCVRNKKIELDTYKEVIDYIK
jgi:hypothetical protein